MKCNENCRFFHRMLNKENIRKYGKSFCVFWHEYKCEGKPCRDFIPKEEESEVSDDQRNERTF